ncbi:hypothetical protein ACOCJ4_13515 [Knoellia sp. CPCC 206435]
MWWIIGLITLFIVCVVVLQRRGAGAGDPNYRPPDERPEFYQPGGGGA